MCVNARSLSYCSNNQISKARTNKQLAFKKLLLSLLASTTDQHTTMQLVSKILLGLMMLSYQQQQQMVVGFITVVPTFLGGMTTTRGRNPTFHRHHQHVLLMSSAPSDSASVDDENDDFSDQGYAATSTTTTDDSDYSTTSTPTTSTGMISKILDMLPSNSFVMNNFDTDEETRSKMNEMIVKLEKKLIDTNPQQRQQQALTSSPLLNGIWELRYVGGYTIPKTPFQSSPTRQLALFLYSGGYSPGVFAYTLAQQLPNLFIDTSEKSVEIMISRSQPRIEASCGIKLFNGAYDGTVKVSANLDIISDVRFRETYESTTIFGQESPINIPQQLRYSRDLYITYLDDDLLIVRDSTGVPEILVRQSKQFMKDWGIEPSMVDDMVPPGDGNDADFLN